MAMIVPSKKEEEPAPDEFHSSGRGFGLPTPGNRCAELAAELGGAENGALSVLHPSFFPFGRLPLVEMPFFGFPGLKRIHHHVT